MGRDESVDAVHGCSGLDRGTAIQRDREVGCGLPSWIASTGIDEVVDGSASLLPAGRVSVGLVVVAWAVVLASSRVVIVVERSAESSLPHAPTIRAATNTAHARFFISASIESGPKSTRSGQDGKSCALSPKTRMCRREHASSTAQIICHPKRYRAPTRAREPAVMRYRIPQSARTIRPHQV